MSLEDTKTEEPTTTTPTANDAPAKTAEPDLAKADEDELLAAVYRKANAGDDAKTEPAGEDDPEKPAKAESDRDEKGRWLSKNPDAKADKAEGEAEPDAEAKADPKKTAKAEKDDTAEDDEPEAEAEEKPKPKKDTSGDFRGWSAEKRAAFEKMPDEAKAFVLSHQKDLTGYHTKREQELTRSLAAAKPFVETVAANKEYLDIRSAELQVTPDKLINNLMKAEETLRWGSLEEKMATLQKWARDYGVPMQVIDDPLAEPTAPGGEAYAKVHDLAQENARLKAQIAHQTRTEQQTNQQALATEVDTFRHAVGADGQPLHPHFDIVRHRMSELLTSGHATTMEDAYAKALAPLLQDTSATRRKAHIATAQRAARLNVTSAPVPVQRFASEDDMLTSVYRQAVAS